MKPEESFAAKSGRTPPDPDSPRSPAQVLDPLYKLATCKIVKGKGQSFADIWQTSELVQDAFEDTKILLEKAVTLNYPIPSAPLALSTDASKTHLGASLDQWDGAKWVPLAFWSKSLKPEQQRYSTYIRELLAIKLSIRHFINEINGRRLTIFTDHKPILGSWNNPDLQMHDSIAMNAINEIAQWTSDIRHKPGKDLVVPDLLSRPFKVPKAYQVKEEEEVEYIPPSATLSAIQEVALNVVSPSAIAEAQEACPDVKRHQAGVGPKGVNMGFVTISGYKLFCELSDRKNPRPLLPEPMRALVLNLLHHQDHPSSRETLRRCSTDYYWPNQRKDVEGFVRTCHPCQVAKNSPTVNPGVSSFHVPDQRFSAIHLDVVGPLPESEGMRFLLTAFCRTSRWVEAFPMASASASECCRAFMGWIERFGVPRTAISDNGNSSLATSTETL